MYAVRIHQTGGPEALVYEEIATPEPGQGEVRIKVAASGVNFIDIYYREGQYKAQLPLTLGSEAAGIVDTLGPGVEGLSVGDHVAYAMAMGSYADYAIVPAARLVPVPSDVDLHQAAAVMLQGMTAHYLTHSTYALKAGDTALVHAAAGGAGLLVVQLAKKCGARVIGTVSTNEKAQLARDAGADEIVMYTQEDFVPAVKRLTEGRGVDVVYDSVGKTTFAGGLDVLRPRGVMVLFGQSSGAVPAVEPQTLNAKGSLFMTRPSLAHYSADRDELLWRSGDLFKWMQNGELQVRIDRSLPLAQAAEAQTALTSRQTSGKLLLVPGE